MAFDLSYLLAIVCYLTGGTMSMRCVSVVGIVQMLIAVTPARVVLRSTKEFCTVHETESQ
jgi:hypothetical protein